MKCKRIATNELTDDISEIGDMLASISGMNEVREAIYDIGGKILSAENDYIIVSCDDIAEASRRLKGSISNVVLGKVNNSTLLVRRGKTNA